MLVRIQPEQPVATLVKLNQLPTSFTPHPVSLSTINSQPNELNMKPVLRYQSQLLFRKSYKPGRTIRIRPVKLKFIFRPVRFGLKPQIKTYECESS